MTTSIIGLFESAEFAKKVLGELARIGCKKDAMEILQDAFTDRISDRLLEAGYEGDKARCYADALQKGGALVVAETDDNKADDALDTMRRLGALSPEALIERIDAPEAERETEEVESAQVIEEELNRAQFEIQRFWGQIFALRAALKDWHLRISNWTRFRSRKGADDRR